ncbi:MAG: hypothetical protein KAT52_06735 [Desulfobacterales bacterium]|nr:hypothetical protein [Desulfobacterales bacterium]
MISLRYLASPKIKDPDTILARYLNFRFRLLFVLCGEMWNIHTKHYSKYYTPDKMKGMTML